MPEVFEEIRQQIHEIRNLVGPFDLKLANLDARIAASRVFFDQRTTLLETKVLATAFRLDEQGGKLEGVIDDYGQLSARVLRLETEMQIWKKQEPAKPLRAHEDNTTPPKNPAS
jgi:hypothetical protein